MSVVIPAHNEEAVIGRALSTILASDPDGLLEIVVAANGCTDGTAQAAASVSPRVRVVEVSTPSKTAALNAGDVVASVFPRAYVDADVTITADALLALAAAFAEDDQVLVASPRLDVDTSRSSWFVKQFYRAWELSDYRTHGHIGSGVYALSAAGRERFGAFPDVIADDRFVQQQFAMPERRTLDHHSFSVNAPRTLRDQIRRSIRIAAGNRQLPRDLQKAEERSGAVRMSALALRMVRSPSLWPALPVYAFGYGVPRVLSRIASRRGVPVPWYRDDSSRSTTR